MTNKSLPDNFYNELNKIVRHYTCPSSCNSICCKYSPLGFEKDEYYRIISVVDQISKDIIEQKTVKFSEHGYYRIFPAGVCPLLYDTKCSIYENRPKVCKRFPIEYWDDYGVIIRPCSLGIDIILDYMCFSGNTSEVEELYNEWLQNQNDTVPVTAYVTGLSLADNRKLKMFNRYLKNTSQEDRKEKREGIIKQIKESPDVNIEKFRIPRTEACF